MLARIGIPFVGNLAAVNAILEQQIECAAGEYLPAIRGAVGLDPLLAPNPFAGKLISQSMDRFQREIAAKDMDNGGSLPFVDDQFSSVHVIAERWHAAHPHALLL